MVQYSIHYYDHEGPKDMIKYIFSLDQPKTKHFKIIPQLISDFDNLLQLKLKLCVYILSKRNIGPEDLYVWLNDSNSPFSPENERIYIDDYTLLKDMKHEVCFTTRQDLLKRMKRKPVSLWVKEWTTFKTHSLHESQIQSIEKHSELVTTIESNAQKMPHNVLQVESHSYTTILVDICEQNESIKIDIERLFNRFKMNENIPICLFKSHDNIKKIKFHKASIKNYDKSFWQTWTKVDSNDRNSDDKKSTSTLKFKFNIGNALVQMDVVSNGGVVVRVNAKERTLNESQWKNMANKIIHWVIDPIQTLSKIKLVVLSYQNFKYRNINSSLYLKNNVNIGYESLHTDFAKYVPYFSRHLKEISQNKKGEKKNAKKNVEQLKFIKTPDYQIPLNYGAITRSTFTYYQNTSNASRHLSLLLMISQDKAEKMVQAFLNEINIRVSRGKKLGKEKAVGNSFSFLLKQSNSEHMKLSLSGKRFDVIEYTIDVIRTVLWLHKKSDITGIEKVSQAIKSKLTHDDESEEESDVDDTESESDDVEEFNIYDQDVEEEDDNASENNESESESVMNKSQDSDSQSTGVNISDSDNESESDNMKNISKNKTINEYYKKDAIILPPEPNEGTKVQFPKKNEDPLWWNSKQSKENNVLEYRSQRIQHYDKNLFSMKITDTGKGAKKEIIFNRRCQPTELHPLAFNTAEYEEILKRLESWTRDHPEKNGPGFSTLCGIETFGIYRANVYACNVCFRCVMTSLNKILPLRIFVQSVIHICIL